MIKEFQGEYRYLSNFEWCDVTYNGKVYPSTEHAYMSAKNDEPNWKKLCQNKDNLPGVIKRKARNVELVPDWETIKYHVMAEVLWEKFNQEPFKTKLLSTGNENIQEGNTWGDKCWGICLKTGNGENHLGRLLMTIRGFIRLGEPKNINKIVELH